MLVYPLSRRKSGRQSGPLSKVDESGSVTQVAEKKRIAELATTGVYFWKRGADFVRCAEAMICKGIRTNNEFYVSPVFNEAIEMNLKVKTRDCRKKAEDQMTAIRRSP